MIGQTVSQYRIIEKLGEGGMGIVYKAQDLKLDRIVALKFLPQRVIADDAERARFVQEAKAASALNHPNICTIYNLEEVENQQFIVMEYVEGTTLAEMSRRGTTNLNTLLSYAIQIGEALDAAHSRGIVHRDVKSENIMVTSDGRMKVMDFGLAKLRGSLKLTKVASTIGTLAYMAPEQIRGGEADHRSDIFSFGVVLYELFTGHLPFRGEHEAAIMYSILNEDPEPPTKYRSDLSPEFQHALNRALEKDPAERYQTIADMLIDLRRLKKESTKFTPPTPPPAIRPKRISKGLWLAACGIAAVAIVLVLVVRRRPAEGTPAPARGSAETQQIKYRLAILPFQNIGADEKMTFLGFALADNIITNLSYLHSIVVRPSSAVSRYRSEMPTNEQIAQQLDVNVLLTGNYLREGDNVHLTAQLVDLANNSVIWQKPIDVQYTSIIALQKEITSEIIRGLQLTLSPAERTKVEENGPRDPVAYENYLRGKTFSASSEAQSLRRAIAFFDEAIVREPTFAPAYADKGFALIYLGIFEGDTSLYSKAEAVLQQALAIDSTLPDALSRLGFLYIQTKQKERAFPILKRAVQVAPNVSDIHNNLAYFYRLCGLLGQSDEEASLALRLNSNDRRSYAYKMFIALMLGRLDTAIAVGGEALRRYPDDSQLLSLRATAFYLGQRYDMLEQDSRGALTVDPQSPIGRLLEALVLSVRGKREQSLKLLGDLEELCKADMEQSFWLAMCYAELGMKDKAAEWLGLAIDGGFDAYPWMARIPAIDRLRDDPSIRRELDRMRQNYERLRAKYGNGGS